MDYAFTLPLEINLSWIADPAYMHRLYRHIQQYRVCAWMYDLARRLHTLLAQGRWATGPGGILQLRFYPMDETGVVLFGMSCCDQAVEDVSTLLHTDAGLGRLLFLRGTRDAQTGLIGCTPVTAGALVGPY